MPSLSNSAETTLIPLVNSFQTFLNYLLKKGRFTLTQKEKSLDKKDKNDLESLLHPHFPILMEKGRNEQIPMLVQFFFQLSHLSGLARIEPEKRHLALHPVRDRIKQFEAMPAPAQYIFLLQTCIESLDMMELTRTVPFWDTNKLSYNFVGWVYPLIVGIANTEPGTVMEVDEDGSIIFPDNGQKLLHPGLWSSAFMHFWGFFEVEWKKDKRKLEAERFPATKVTVTGLGFEICEALMESRSVLLWNKKHRDQFLGGHSWYRQKTREDLVLQYPKEKLPQGGKLTNEEWNILLGNWPPETFHQAFNDRLGEAEFEGYLEPELAEKPGNREGLYILQITEESYVDPDSFEGMYRTLAISGSHTFVDLEEAIMKHMKFSDERLNWFFYLPKGSDRKHQFIIGKSTDSKPTAGEVKIGDVLLHEGMEDFRFHLSEGYGQSWVFPINVLRIEPSSNAPDEIQLTDKKGEAPVQYYDYG